MPEHTKNTAGEEELEQGPPSPPPSPPPGPPPPVATFNARRQLQRLRAFLAEFGQPPLSPIEGLGSLKRKRELTDREEEEPKKKRIKLYR
ncbi:hypothetical protein HBI56_022820 [Parastagonospora nodorum]|nr:hypothetical protein HBH53_084010 [Parastagonospora nodorum]KAH3975948.1 hypothetical protein HBH51_081340 [Parastagonospora nodorum]KAH4006144.1 hypothetical protein HBI10_027320 [Parastagonospora nodorum]KAH4023138.1 hypothetical protein HBI13_094930 [Parastagonospora nodorum]KAH4055013.1 hypothetical protein HBH49_070250 [Parastagonospora nodorum]